MFYRHWNADMVIDHINMNVGREPLNSHYYATRYPSVYAAATRIFGSWREAIIACGIDYATVRKYREWSDERVIGEIRKMHADKIQLSSQYIQNNYKPLYLAAVKRFRSWGEAVRRAGIDYAGVRLRRSMTPEEIKQKIIELYSAGESLAYTNIRKHYQYLLANASRKIGSGSWSSARKVCGVKTNYRSLGQKSKARLLKNFGPGKAAY